MFVIKRNSGIENDNFAYRLVEKLKDCVRDDSAIAYYMFPLYIGDVNEDNIVAKILFISKDYGIFYFDTKNTNESIADTEVRMNELYNCLSSKIKQLPDLCYRRNLKYEIFTVLVSDEELNVSEDFLFSNFVNISNLLDENKYVIEENDFKLLQSCIEGTLRANQKIERKIPSDKKTKSSILSEIQSHIARYDIDQKQAALTELDSPQRIRGLAGSGKTIVLTQKAALYHLNHKDDHILYTYYTKSLHDTIKNHIDRAYKYFSNNREPNWDKITICHAWGSNNVTGTYSLACEDNGVNPMDFLKAVREDSKDPFGYACSKLMENNIRPAYDLILIDEGQDFTPPFYQLCYKLSKNKKIAWAYDDFQNIFNVEIQDERETFGQTNGVYNVDFNRDVIENSDIVLSKCYRTPRIPLIAAFSLGLGIYNTAVLQRLSSNDLWKSLGFEVVKGTSTTGDEMVIRRPEENTPSYSNNEFGVGCISYKKFNNIDNECDFIANQIAKDISEENLLPSDILVICLDRKYIASYFDKISVRLIHKGFESFNHLSTYSSNLTFSRQGYVTLSTINKAKGNECPCVYVCGIDHIFSNPNNVVLRDTLFTAMTRTKGWLTLTGCTDDFDKCIYELKKLQENNFELHFIQPSETQTKNIEDQSRKENEAINIIDAKISQLKSLGKTNDDIIKEMKRLLGINNDR